MLVRQKTSRTPMVLLFGRSPSQLLKDEMAQLIAHLEYRPQFLAIYPRSPEEFHLVCSQQNPTLILLPYVAFHESAIPLPFMPFMDTLLGFTLGYFDYDPSPIDCIDSKAFRFREYEHGTTLLNVVPWRKSA